MIAHPLTTFIGRSEQIRAVCELVRDHRLVTLVGSGGCGKTRLAVEVVRRVEADFDDGVSVVELAPVDSEAVVASVVAACTGVSEAGGAPVSTLLRAGLAHRNLLLVIDNCEHLVDACAGLVHDVLTHCPDLTVFATSRTPLSIDGEMVWRVPSLTLPSIDAADPLADIDASESGRLLLDRARLARPDLTLTDEDGRAAISICRRLDGVPLAIELAASRLRAFTMRDLATALDDRFGVLTAGSRTAPPRQRTLEASIDWSYELLGEEERALLCRLAVFAGSFDVAAAEALCTDNAVAMDRVRTVLADLVDHSLVQIDIEGESRYRMFESVRSFGLGRLADRGEEAMWRDRHLAHVRSITQWFDSIAESRDLEQANGRVESVLAEIRAALEWALRSGQSAAAAAIAADLRLYWLTQDRNKEGRMWLAAVIDEAQGADDDNELHRARAQVAAAQLALEANDPYSQHELAAAGLGTVRRLGRRDLEPLPLILCGWAQIFLSPPDAPTLLDEAWDLAEALGDDARQEYASFGLGLSAVFRGDLTTANQRLATASVIAEQRRSIGRHFVRAILAYARLLQGDVPAGAELLEEVLAEEAGFDQTGFDLAHTVYGLALILRGDWDEGRQRLCDVADRAKAALRNPALYAEFHLAMLERGVGNYEACGGHLDDVDLFLGVPGLTWFRIQALVWRGDLAVARGDRAGAEACWREALSLSESSGNPLSCCVANLGLARGARLGGDIEGARAWAGKAVEHGMSAAYRLGSIDGLELLATLPGPNQNMLIAAVAAERARIGLVRAPVDEPAWDAAVAAVGDRCDGHVTFDDAVSLALGVIGMSARPVTGWGSLTPAEVRVAELVSRGLTNPEVGEKLFISRRTVQAHLSHIYAKLDVANRAELAAQMARHTE